MKKFVIVFSEYAGILLGAAGVNEMWEHRPAGPAPAVTGTLVFARGDDIVVADEPGETLDTPAWASDGQSILFGQYGANGVSVNAVDLASGRRSTVIQNATSPSTSASGTLSWVAFNRSDATFALRVGAANTVVSSDDFQAIYSPRLSPDGQFIVFSASGRTHSSVPARGISLRVLLAPVAEAHGLPSDVWSIRVDGSDLTEITNLGTDEQSLAWMPDGQAIAVVRLGGLYLAHPNGSGLHQILGHGMARGLDWKAPREKEVPNA